MIKSIPLLLLLGLVLVSVTGCGSAALDDAIKQRDRALRTLEKTTQLVQASKDKAEADRRDALEAKAQADKDMRIAMIERKKALEQLRKIQSELTAARKKIKSLEVKLEEFHGKSK